MTEKQMLERITTDPQVITGKPIIKGTRLTVEYILGLLAQDWTTEDIQQEYPDLAREDIQACLLFATKSLESTVFMPISAETV